MPERAVPPIARCLGVARNATKATVFVITRDDGTVVRKEMLHETGGPLGALGRFLLRRETVMLRALAPTGVVPRVLASGDGWLETEHVPGETVSARRQLGISPDDAARLREALRRFHESGFAHGDLGRRDLLLGRDGRVVILDVATSVGPGHPPVLGRLLAPLVRRLDHHRLNETIRKAIARHEDWEEQEAALGAPVEETPTRVHSAR